MFLQKFAETDISRFPLVDAHARIGSPIAMQGKIVCVGLNYADHTEETGFELPYEPLVLFKSPTALSGPFDPIVIPKTPDAVDWEVELGVVIGGFVRNVPERDARDVIAGFVVADDLTDRGWQFERGGQWSKGKSADSFAPVGPWLVTSDQFPDTPDLAQKEHRHETR